MTEDGGGENIRVPDWYLQHIEGKEGHPNRLIVQPDLILDFDAPDLEKPREALRGLEGISGQELKDNIQEHFGVVLDAQAAELREMQKKFDSKQSREYHIAKAAAEATDAYFYDDPNNRQTDEVRVTVVERNGKLVTLFNSPEEGITYNYSRHNVGIDYANTHYYDLQADKIDGKEGVKDKLIRLKTGMKPADKEFLLRHLVDQERNGGLAINLIRKIGPQADNAVEIKIIKAFYEKIIGTSTADDTTLAREQKITGGVVDTKRLQPRQSSLN
jgi:hypothetical protein